jgi:hypothetical protein
MSAAMTFDKRDATTSLRSAFPPAGGAVQRRKSRGLKEAVRRLDGEVDALLVELGAPFHTTLQEIAEHMAGGRR